MCGQNMSTGCTAACLCKFKYDKTGNDGKTHAICWPCKARRWSSGCHPADARQGITWQIRSNSSLSLPLSPTSSADSETKTLAKGSLVAVSESRRAQMPIPATATLSSKKYRSTPATKALQGPAFRVYAVHMPLLSEQPSVFHLPSCTEDFKILTRVVS